MGLLSQGSPLNWEETKKHADHVRKHGILQFLNIYNKVKERQRDVLKWGDEVEYMLVEMDDKNGKVRLVLNGKDVLEILQEKGENINPNHPTLWRPEYGSYMIEGTPGQPYGGTMSEFNTVEDNMGKRRREAASVLNKNETLLTVTSFPRLGCPGFTQPEYKPTPVEKGVSKSLFFPDEAINRHPRFSTLTRNIRHRRGEKVVINVPIFKDKNTPSPFVETFAEDDGEAVRGALPDHIYMDAMGFGMGNCCLQVTFQACSIREARYLYDQLATFCPIVMALSAASPFYRGFVSDIDCRWGVISASVDDRTSEERGLEPLKNDKFRIHKSRYDSIDSYLSCCGEKYNDIELTIDEDINKQLLDAGIDRLLAQHIAHLFIRDPLSLFQEKIHLDDENESDHFENLQSTNWQTMRFKPPPPNSDIGWRVEFRPMEVLNKQPSARCLSVCQMICALNVYFPPLLAMTHCRQTGSLIIWIVLLIFLVMVVFTTVLFSGELMTMAKWMREFVSKHPQYKQDSVITDKINYDLLHKCDRIARGEEKCPELIGDPPISNQSYFWN
uniref:Glutamate--cysteine ligase n=1 Tax=Sinocyclocheilus grahami TaxID=75366 RepID=A0A672RSB9_SINGR